MIINSLCNSCFQPFVLLIEPGEVGLVKDISDDNGELCPCPRLCGGKINLVGDPTITALANDGRSKQPMTVTGKQLYQAVNGLGLPDEIPKDGATIDALLRANPVTKVVIEEGNGKFYLHELHLQNNLVVHLASGVKGAQVLKVTKVVANG